MADGSLEVGAHLDACLARAVSHNPALKDTAAVVSAIAGAAITISEVIGRGALGGDL
ncbi:class 1 fructose-bisphosphatase, partial [Methylobacterium hispanicum]